MREQSKELFNDKHQLQKIFLNVDDLMLKHDIKLDNKHDFKLVFRWNKSFRIQRADSMKDIYILKEMNEIRLERIYTDNRLKRFKTKNVKNSLTKQIAIHEMLNIVLENSIDAAVQNIAESLNADSQIFENDAINNNLSKSKARNTHARVKSSTRRSNRLIKIENSLSSVRRSTSTAAFATIDEVSIEKKWNAIKIEKFETYTNDCNSEDFLIALLILRNRPFAINILSKQSTLSMNYAKKKNDDAVAIIENTNFYIFIVVLDLPIS